SVAHSDLHSVPTRRSSDLAAPIIVSAGDLRSPVGAHTRSGDHTLAFVRACPSALGRAGSERRADLGRARPGARLRGDRADPARRSEEHTSDSSHLVKSYAV